MQEVLAPHLPQPAARGQAAKGVELDVRSLHAQARGARRLVQERLRRRRCAGRAPGTSPPEPEPEPGDQRCSGTPRFKRDERQRQHDARPERPRRRTPRRRRRGRRARRAERPRLARRVARRQKPERDPRYQVLRPLALALLWPVHRGDGRAGPLRLDLPARRYASRAEVPGRPPVVGRADGARQRLEAAGEETPASAAHGRSSCRGRCWDTERIHSAGLWGEHRHLPRGKPRACRQRSDSSSGSGAACCASCVGRCIRRRQDAAEAQARSPSQAQGERRAG